MQICQVCGKTCQPLRCTRCHKAYYCSIACQKKDWKAGHRQSCRCDGPSQESAEWALQRLVGATCGMTADETKQHMEKAGDEVKRIQKERDKEMKQENRQKHGTRSTQKKEIGIIPKMDQPASGEKNSAMPLPLSEAAKTLRQLQEKRFELMMAEEMKHIPQFQLTLRPKRSLDVDVGMQSLRLSTTQINGSSSSLVEILSEKGNATFFSVVLPRRVENGRVQVLDGQTLHLSLPCRNDPTERELGSERSLTTIEKINSILCGFCKHPLLPLKPIQRTSELPLGHWNEISDYLICYSGQPVVDFSTLSAVPDPSVALQDSNVLCLNHTDLSGTACVLAVPGYGEGDDDHGRKQDEKTADDELVDASAAVRGDRSWRDVTSGATVCCSQCSAPLGFAAMESPESFRLLKHRLSIPTHSPRRVPSQRLSSCASFLAREMVRYAEAKAIFTFIVTLDAPKMSFASSVFEKCILLRLVSWDCNIATGVDGGSRKLKFRRYAKLVFEETYDRKANQSAGVGTWMWGGVDLCCPPVLDSESAKASSLEVTDESINEATEQSVSTARILLQEDEYSETLQSLRQGQKLFPKDVAEPTILVKMGVAPSSKIDGGGLGLTAIPL